MTTGPDSRDPLEIRAQIPILEQRTYLNSCSLGALSVRSDEYLDDFRARWHELGASAWYEHWLARLEALRSLVARFHGAAPESLAHRGG